MRGQDPQTKVLHELWSMIVHVFRSQPLPVAFPSLSPSATSPSTSSPSRRLQISPAAFGLLFIGIAMALMLFGIVTFLIGFVLMPLVTMLVMLFYFVGIVSKLSEIGRSILWPSADCNKVALDGVPHVLITCSKASETLQTNLAFIMLALLFPVSSTNNVSFASYKFLNL